MRVSRRVLQRYTTLPDDDHALRLLLDDVGLEVKRMFTANVANAPDTLVDLELLANRGDHHCYAGVARELHGRTGLGLALPASTALDLGDATVAVCNETALCLRYTLTPLQLDGEPKELPESVFMPVEAADIHRISPAVDVSNLVNIEIGQPIHVFDADTIRGTVRIRLSRKAERAWPLFSEERIELPEGTVVIADDEKVLAIAGVIGCQESMTTRHSRRLLVESATFDPVSVRRTSRALKIRTDSSVRFERGGDPLLALGGAGRAVYLLEQHVGATRTGATVQVGEWSDPAHTISLQPQAACAFLGIELPADEMAQRLERYGFCVDGRDPLRVRVPPARLWDVSLRADLYEELAKSVGYQTVPEQPLPSTLGSVPSYRERVRALTDEVLVGLGFYEVFTDGFYGSESVQRMGLDDQHPLSDHVRVKDAVDRGHSLLKNNGLIQLLEAVSENARRDETELRAFEWARTFHPDPKADNGLCRERVFVAAICCGPVGGVRWGAPAVADVWFLKGVVEELSLALRVPLTVGALAENHPLSDILHPGRRAAVFLEGKPVGLIAEVHPELVRRAGIKTKDLRPCYLEIDRSALEHEPVAVAYRDPPDQSPTLRNLAFSMPLGVEARRVLEVMEGSGAERLQYAKVVDVYEHELEGKPVRTLTFELAWSNEGGTLTADALNQRTEALIDLVENRLRKYNVRLRGGSR